jgi:Flp pilus assembly protein TadD
VRPDRSLVLSGALLVVIVLVSYAPAFQAGYVIDDENYVTENPTLRDRSGLKRIWFELGASPQYYPLVYTSFWLEYQAWELDPRGYHAVNILLHALNALLLWIILRRLNLPAAWFAAALFALHPVHVESVAWVAERKNVLSAAFYLLAIIAYMRFSGLDRPPDAAFRRSWRWYLLSLALYAAALLSKTATVSLPAALLLLLWWKRDRASGRDAMPLLPLFAAGLGMGLLTLWVETTLVGASGALWDLSWLERILVAGRAGWFYAWKLVWPLGLSFNYVRWTIDAGTLWQYLPPLAGIAVVSWLWAARERIGRGPLVAVLYFVGTLAPTLGFFNVFFFRYSYVADHFQYLASIGLIVLIVAAAATWLARQRRRWEIQSLVLGVLVLSALGVLTWTRAAVYENLESLCRDTLRKNPSSWLARNNLGNIYMQRGDLQEAVAEFRIAHDAAPTYIETHLNLAIALMNLERFDESMHHARRAIEIDPHNSFGYHHLGGALLRAGRSGESIRWFGESLRREPGSLKSQLDLGIALARTGQSEEAIDWLESVLRDEPQNLTAHTNLGIALVQVGRLRDAIGHLEEAARLDPENPIVRQNLSLARERARQVAPALGDSTPDGSPGTQQ